MAGRRTMESPQTDRMAGLLLKAIRSLPPRQQDELLRGFLRPVLAARPSIATPPPPVAPSSDVLFFHEELVPGPMPPAALQDPTCMLPIRLTPQTRDRLRLWATDHGFSMAAVVRGLIERFLDEQEGGRAPSRRPRTPRRRTPPRAS
jgi:hypothetical protein